MKKLSHIAIVLALASFFFLPLLSLAQTSDLQSKIDSIRAERDALLETQKKLQTALDELNKEGQSLTTNIKTLDASRQKLQNDLKITQNSIDSSNLQIQKLGDAISDNESQIENNKSAIKESLRKISSYDAENSIMSLLAHASFTDIWTDTANLMNAQDALKEAIDSLEMAQKSLTENQAASIQKKRELVSYSSELAGQKQVIDTTRQAQAKLLTATQSKEAAYQKMLADNIAKEKEFEAQLFQYESQLKESDHGALPSIGRGVLSWPLDSVTITQQFGKTTSSGRLYSSGTHNGVDFRASVGTPVKSVRGGVVEAMGNTDSQPGCYSYGRWVLIQHDNGLTSLYAHLSASIVTTGEAVATGDIIGYSGGQPGASGSGYSTGPHLHLGLFATAGVEVSRYTSSINCKNVSIPIANPGDYLDPLAYMP